MIGFLSLLLFLGGILWGVSNSITDSKLAEEVKKSRLLVICLGVLYILVILAVILGGKR
jgi:hypothetical protein